MNELLSCAGHCWFSDGEEQTTRDAASSLGVKQTHGMAILPCLLHTHENSQGTKRGR